MNYLNRFKQLNDEAVEALFDLVKNMMKDKKKNKDEGQTFLDSYLA